MAYYVISFYGATANNTNLSKILLQQKTILCSPVCLYANTIDCSTFSTIINQSDSYWGIIIFVISANLFVFILYIIHLLL